MKRKARNIKICILFATLSLVQVYTWNKHKSFCPWKGQKAGVGQKKKSTDMVSHLLTWRL